MKEEGHHIAVPGVYCQLDVIVFILERAGFVLVHSSFICAAAQTRSALCVAADFLSSTDGITALPTS